jgi:hypothetical protein
MSLPQTSIDLRQLRLESVTPAMLRLLRPTLLRTVKIIRRHRKQIESCGRKLGLSLQETGRRGVGSPDPGSQARSRGGRQICGHVDGLVADGAADVLNDYAVVAHDEHGGHQVSSRSQSRPHRVASPAMAPLARRLPGSPHRITSLSKRYPRRPSAPGSYPTAVSAPRHMAAVADAAVPTPCQRS